MVDYEKELDDLLFTIEVCEKLLRNEGAHTKHFLRLQRIKDILHAYYRELTIEKKVY